MSTITDVMPQSIQDILDQWFDRGLTVLSEYGYTADYILLHKQAILTALEFGLIPPDWPNYLDFMRDGDLD